MAIADQLKKVHKMHNNINKSPQGRYPTYSQFVQEPTHTMLLLLLLLWLDNDTLGMETVESDAFDDIVGWLEVN